MDKELLSKPRVKKEAFRKWKQGQMGWEEDRGIVQEVRDKVREAKALIELSLVVDIEDNRKGFYRYITSKRKTRDNLDSLP